MSTTKLFKKHFGDTASVDMKHKNAEKFFSDMNDECLEEDKQKKCNLDSVSKLREPLIAFMHYQQGKVGQRDDNIIHYIDNYLEWKAIYGC